MTFFLWKKDIRYQYINSFQINCFLSITLKFILSQLKPFLSHWYFIFLLLKLSCFSLHPVQFFCVLCSITFPAVLSFSVLHICTSKTLHLGFLVISLHVTWCSRCRTKIHKILNINIKYSLIYNICIIPYNNINISMYSQTCICCPLY
jgi:hypothetical protein